MWDTSKNFTCKYLKGYKNKQGSRIDLLKKWVLLKNAINMIRNTSLYKYTFSNSLKQRFFKHLIGLQVFLFVDEDKMVFVNNWLKEKVQHELDVVNSTLAKITVSQSWTVV